MTDPENSTDLPRADLEEVEIDEADESSRGLPLEADPADVAEQRHDVPTPPEEDELG
jgi:hypothetical protein